MTHRLNPDTASGRYRNTERARVQSGSRGALRVSLPVLPTPGDRRGGGRGRRCARVARTPRAPSAVAAGFSQGHKQ